MTIGKCRWCQAPIRINRRRGSPAQFCSEAHRQTFWAALRARAAALFDAGEITIEMLKRGP
jgi:hypothetical protein